MERLRLWQTRSGRMHWLRSCSGGATPRTTKAVRLSRRQYEAAFGANKLCRCAWNLEHRFEEEK